MIFQKFSLNYLRELQLKYLKPYLCLIFVLCSWSWAAYYIGLSFPPALDCWDREPAEYYGPTMWISCAKPFDNDILFSCLMRFTPELRVKKTGQKNRTKNGPDQGVEQKSDKSPKGLDRGLMEGWSRGRWGGFLLQINLAKIWQQKMRLRQGFDPEME